MQGTVGAQGLTRIIDVPHVTNGLLNEDGIMNLKQAVWLNETGVSIHMETTLMIDFASGQIDAGAIHSQSQRHR